MDMALIRLWFLISTIGLMMLVLLYLHFRPAMGIILSIGQAKRIERRQHIQLQKELARLELQLAVSRVKAEKARLDALTAQHDSVASYYRVRGHCVWEDQENGTTKVSFTELPPLKLAS
jgi:hypothetical protein